LKSIDFTKLKEFLPVHPGIDGKEEFVNSGVLVPLILVNDEYHLLFEKRNEKIRQGGEICFPGGMFDHDKDGSFTDTALRETEEELGINRKDISVLGSLDTVMTLSGVTVDPVLSFADVKNIDGLVINTNEVESAFSINLDFFINNEPEKYKVKSMMHPSFTDNEGNEVVLLPSKELGLPDIYTRPWGGLLHNVYVYKTKYGVIWGITARIIKQVVDIVNKLT
jgi:peroxisomal coenzyme A diphosphatase NUDT7